MPYIGRAATNAGSVNYLDDISSGFDGSDTTFTCAISGTTITPGQENVFIYLDGVFQDPGSSKAYTISGSTITFTEAPANGTVFTGYVAGEGAYLDDGTVSTAKLDDDAVTASKLDDDGTGFQVGDLGVGGSLTSGDKLTVTGRLRASGGIIGDLTGNVTGNTSGTAATVTGAAQSAITSVGTLTGLTSSSDVLITGGNALQLRETDTYINSPSSDRIDFRTGGTIGLYIDSSQDATFASWATITEGLIVNESGGDNDVRMESDGNDNMFRLDASVNRIGIGESSPGSTLDVKSAEAANTANFNSTSGATNITFESSGSLIGQMEFVSSGTSAIVTRTSASLALGSNNVRTLYITDDDKVGIGTDSPTDVLSITDGASMYAADPKRMIQLKRNATNSHDDNSFCGMLFANNSNGWHIGYGGTSDRFRFIDGGGVERLWLAGFNNNWCFNLTANSPYGMQITTTASNSSSHDMFKVKRGDGTTCIETWGDGNTKVENEIQTKAGLRTYATNGGNPSGDFYNVAHKFATYKQVLTASHITDGYVTFSNGIYRDNVLGIIANYFGYASGTNNNYSGYNSAYITRTDYYASNVARAYLGSSATAGDFVYLTIIYHGNTG